MIVYRIEKEDGVGPYFSRNYKDLVDENGMTMLEYHGGDYINHPCPPEDGIRDIEPEEFCGFESMDALNDWFEDWIPILIEAGYKIVTYDVSTSFVRFGKKQLVFNKDFAERVDND